MYSNQVWLLVDPPDGVKPIGCKWIYKRKRGVDRKVETFKARIVTKGYLFYDPKEQRVLVSTNTHFLKHDYMLDNKPSFKVVLDELRAELSEGNEVPIPETEVSQPLVARTQETRVPRRSGRVVTQPERFIGLGEISVDPKIDPSSYNKAV